MYVARIAGATSEIWQLFIADSSSTTGGGLTGLTNATSGLTAYYHRDTDTTATAISIVSMTSGTFTSGGFKEVDPTNMPGVYEFCPPNAAITTGAKNCIILLKGAANMAPLPILVDLDAQVDVRAYVGTVISAPATAGIPDVNIKAINNVTAATPGASGGVLISGSNSGTTTFGALTVTGTLTASDGFVVNRSTSNATAVTFTGNGTGNGLICISGSGAAGDGAQFTSNATNGNGQSNTGKGTGAGSLKTGGATGPADKLVGGSTSGDGTIVTVTSGHGYNIVATGTAKDALHLVGAAAATTNAAGHGINTVGGASSTSAGGIAGVGLNTLGGAGSASTNGAGDGAIFTGGGTTTVSGGSGMTLTHTGSKNDFNATSTPLTLAKTTNITGFNDIAATAIVSSGAITTSSGAVSTVTTVTNQLTAAAIATGVWTDTTPGDFTTSLSVGKSIMNGVSLGTGLTVAAVSGAVGSVTGAVGSVTAAVSVTGDLSSTMKTSVGVAVWDLATSGHTTSGTFGAAMSAAGAAGDPWSTSLPGSYGVGTAGNIVGNRIDAAITSRMATFTLPSNFSALSISAGGKINGVVLVDTLTTYTNNVPQTGDSYADVSSGTFGLSALGNSIGAIASALIASAGNLCQTGSTSSTIKLNASESSTSDFFKGCWATIAGGTGQGQAPRLITAYNGGSKVASVIPAWNITPDSSSQYTIVGRAGVDVEQWGAAAVTGMPMPTYSQPTGFLTTTFSTTVGTSTYAGGAVASVTAPVTLSQSFPVNFGNMSINSSGQLDIAKVNGSTTAAITLMTIYGQGAFLGSVSGSTSTTQFADSTLGFSTDSVIVGRTIQFLTGTLVGSFATIVGYSHTTKVVSVWPPLATSPNNADTYIIMPGGALVDFTPVMKTSLNNSTPTIQIESTSFTGASDVDVSSGKVAENFFRFWGNGDQTATNNGADALGYLNTLPNLQTMLQSSGSDYQFTEDALAEAPAGGGGGGSGDWTTTEKNQIRNRLGIDGAAASPSAVPTLVDAALDKANGVETGVSLRTYLRRSGAVLFNKRTGAGSRNQKFRDAADTKDRISANLDAAGNRTGITYDDS